MLDESAVGFPRAERANIASRSEDAGARLRHVAAIATALLLHAAIIPILVVYFPDIKTFAPPILIPVEVVAEAPSKPPVQANAAPESPTEPQRPHESGANADLTPGRTHKVAPPLPAIPAAKPHRAHRPISEPQRAAEASPSTELSTVVQPSSSPPPETQQAMIPAPSLDLDRALPQSQNPQPGEGGGDPYLNAVRDTVLRHFVYPPAARLAGLSGTAQYKINLDRHGNVIDVRVLQSSGSATLDEAGLETIKKAGPFGPLPPDVTSETAGLVFVLHMAP